MNRKKLSKLLRLQYTIVSDTPAQLGGVPAIRGAFTGLQPQLFSRD